MIKIWKNKAHTKTITRADMVAYCALRALKAENTSEAFEFLVKKAFTPGKVMPHRPTPYHAIYVATEELHRELKYRKTLLGSKELYESTDIEKFKELIK
jgi:hypothetical protein